MQGAGDLTGGERNGLKKGEGLLLPQNHHPKVWPQKRAKGKGHCPSGYQESWSRSLPWRSFGERQSPTSATLMRESSCPACPESKTFITPVLSLLSSLHSRLLGTSYHFRNPESPSVQLLPFPDGFPLLGGISSLK